MCGQSGPPGGPLCVHHAYLESMTPASLVFCRNIIIINPRVLHVYTQNIVYVYLYKITNQTIIFKMHN